MNKLQQLKRKTPKAVLLSSPFLLIAFSGLAFIGYLDPHMIGKWCAGLFKMVVFGFTAYSMDWVIFDKSENKNYSHSLNGTDNAVIEMNKRIANANYRRASMVCVGMLVSGLVA